MTLAEPDDFMRELALGGVVSKETELKERQATLERWVGVRKHDWEVWNAELEAAARRVNDENGRELLKTFLDRTAGDYDEVFLLIIRFSSNTRELVLGGAHCAITTDGCSATTQHRSMTDGRATCNPCRGPNTSPTRLRRVKRM